MQSFVPKTFADSYLFNVDISNKGNSDIAKKNSAAIRDFIISSHRIDDRESDAFRGIIEDLKRQQRSSILVTLALMNSNIKLCIGKAELPAAFKVFSAKDFKENKKQTVFIDVTGIIEYRGGYYTCKRIDILCAYLMEALVYLLYHQAPEKLINNSSITTIVVDNYISMFTYILDYLRVSNFRENKNKISYFIGLFFLHHMMGAPLDPYNKNIAAKCADIPKANVNSMDLYLDDNTFDNINTFITWLAKTFKLSGLTLAIFISKWAQLFGRGTQYASELYTSFVSVNLAAFSQAYIVNQVQIERSCSSNNLIKLWKAIEAAGESKYDMRGFMSESARKIYEIHDKNTLDRKVALERAKELGSEVITEADFKSNTELGNRCDSVIKQYKLARMEHKLNVVAENAIALGIEAAYNQAMNILECNTDYVYENGALGVLTKKFKDTVDSKQRYNIESTIDRDINALKEVIRESDAPKQNIQAACAIVNELRDCRLHI